MKKIDEVKKSKDGWKVQKKQENIQSDLNRNIHMQIFLMICTELRLEKMA